MVPRHCAAQDAAPKVVATALCGPYEPAQETHPWPQRSTRPRRPRRPRSTHRPRSGWSPRPRRPPPRCPTSSHGTPVSSGCTRAPAAGPSAW